VRYDPERHHRRSVRLEGDVYRHGWYFVTICAVNRLPLFGAVAGDTVNHTNFGHLAEVFWREIPQHFPFVDLDAFVIMPNHLHGILHLHPEQSDHVLETRDGFRTPVAGSLATIIRSFKAASSRSINIVRDTPGEVVWQRGFHEHVIRNERELDRIRR
jgi:REP element-mobilizing transposase RayT